MVTGRRVFTLFLCLFLSGCGLAALGAIGGATALQKSPKTQPAIPEPVSVVTPATVVFDRVSVDFTLTDPSIQSFDVLVEYSLDRGETFRPATEAIGAPSEGTSGLTSTPAGIPHIFIWNSFADLDPQQIASSSNIVVRVSAFTRGAGSSSPSSGRVPYGLRAKTSPFSVDNRLVATVVAAPSNDAEGLSLLAVPLNAPTCAIVYSGNVLCADTGNNRIRLGDTAARIVVTIAGSSIAGLGLDNISATGARLLGPRSIAVDLDKNFIIADSDNHRIRKVDQLTQIITTIGGIGSASYTGDNGPAKVATMNTPQGLVVDGSGNILFTDTGNHVVRSISPTGVITTVAGTGVAGFTGDGGAAIAAQLSSPQALAVDRATNIIYVADTNNHVVRSFQVGGAMTTVAGTGSPGLGAEGVLATATTLSSPSGICLQGDSVVVSDTGNNRIRRFKPGSKITTVAGSVSGQAGFTGDNGPAVSATMNGPSAVSEDGAGGFVIADTRNNRIRQVDKNGTIRTALGVGTVASDYVGDGGPPLQATFLLPEQIARRSDGLIGVGDSFGFRVRGFTINGTMSTIAGRGFQGLPNLGDGGAATDAPLNLVRGITFDSAGNLFLADTNSNVVRAVSTVTGVITTVAGTASPGNGPDGVVGPQSALNSPRELMSLPGNQIVISDFGGHRIRLLGYTFVGGAITPGIISTICGTAGTPGFAGDGGPATACRVTAPLGLSLDAQGNVVFCDQGNQVIRQFTIGGNITTIAGTPGVSGFVDNVPATAARFAGPFGVAVDVTRNVGTIYVADFGNHRVRRFRPGGTIDTVAGNGRTGDSGDGGPATAANITRPRGILVNPTDGAVVVAAQGTSRLFRFLPDGIINAIAGAPAASIIGDGGPSVQARLKLPQYTFFPFSDNRTFYIADLFNQRLRRVDWGTGTITTICGQGIWSADGDGGPATQGFLGLPFGGAVDSAGNIFVADSQNHLVRKIDQAGLLSTIAGTGIPGSTGDGGPAAVARLNQPVNLKIHPDGSMYVAEFLGFRLRRIDATGMIATVAGTGAPAGGGGLGDDVPPLRSPMVTPCALAIGNDGSVYFSEFAGHRVRKFAINGNVFTVAGSNGRVAGFSGDNIQATSALLNTPIGIDVDGAGNVYIADSGNNRIRFVSAGFIKTIGGNGIRTGGNDGVLPTQTTINFPVAVSVDRLGNIYVSEANANRIRRFRLFP